MAFNYFILQSEADSFLSYSNSFPFAALCVFQQHSARQVYARAPANRRHNISAKLFSVCRIFEIAKLVSGRRTRSGQLALAMATLLLATALVCCTMHTHTYTSRSGLVALAHGVHKSGSSVKVAGEHVSGVAIARSAYSRYTVYRLHHQHNHFPIE